jgi:putative ABC transport system permease protein
VTFSPSFEFIAALRRLLRTPAFSLAVIALLAVSISGAAAIATAGYSLFAQPLPYHQPERLVSLGIFSKRIGSDLGLSSALVNELNTTEDFGRIGTIDAAFDLELESGENVRAASIDQHAVQVLGLAPVSGRLFAQDDVRPGAEPVAVVSEQLARDRFGSVDAAVGALLPTSSERLRVVGVMPQAFAMPESDVGLWLPMTLGPDKLGSGAMARFGNLIVVARVGEGETPETMAQQLDSRFDEDPRVVGPMEMLQAEYRVRPLRELWSDGEGEVLMVLGLAVGLVLIASVFNVAGLWMARWFVRSHEMAIRSALGSGQRLVLLGAGIEYLLLALPAAMLSFPVAAIGIEFLYSLEILDDNGPLSAAPGIMTALIALGMVVVAAFPVLLSLAWQMRGIAASAVGFLTGGGIARRAHGARLRQWLMVAQIGVAFSLLLVLGLLLSSWSNLLEEDLGFERDGLVALQVSSGELGSSGMADTDAQVAVLADVLAGLPGVEAVSWSNVVPFGRMEIVSSISLDGSGGDTVPARTRSVGPDFFRVAEIELRRGRRFGPEDATEEVQNVIVDQLFVDQYLGGDEAGRSFGLTSGGDRFTPVSIIGVVESVRHMSPDEEGKTPTVYTYQDAPSAQIQLLLRTEISPDALVETVRRTAIDALGEQHVGFVATLESLVRRTVRDREPQLLLMSVFAGLALVLVFYGLYALQSYQVAARTAEIGLRKAMGASGRHMLGQVLGPALLMLIPGLALGVAGGWVGAHLVADRLYAISLADPLLWSSVALAIGIVITIAAFVPALRAVRIPPMEALRHD